MPVPLDNDGEFVLAFHVPSNCSTPVKALFIAVCICAPVAKAAELAFTVAVTGVNVFAVVPLEVKVELFPVATVFT